MELKKELNLLDVFCITSGAMMSSGLFLLPGLAFSKAGPAMILSYLFAAFLACMGMLSQAELASAMPKAGGTYFYVARSMGRGIGTAYGLVTLVALVLKSAFEIVGMSAIIALAIDIDPRLIGTVLCAFFVILNMISTRDAGRMQIGLVVCILAGLGLYVLMGGYHIHVHNFAPFAPHGKVAVFSTAGLVFVSYGGLLKIASVAEEVKDPGRTLPLGMILSLVAIIVVYSTVLFITVGVLDGDILSSTTTPISDAAGAFMGNTGLIVLSICAVLAFTSAANAGIMGASRYPLALSRDELLPEFFGKVNRRFGTPHVALIVTGLMMVSSLFVDIEKLAEAASSVLILTYVFTCAAVIILRESHIQNYRPRFRSPLYPWVQLAGIAGTVFLLVKIGDEALLATGSLALGGFLVYWFYGRKTADREYALLHLVERLTQKDLTDHMLETELKEIIRNRDELEKDRFDHIIEESLVLDLDNPMGAEEFFGIVAGKVAEELDIEPSRLVEQLMQREREGSTVISPTLAIPHAIVEGEKVFRIVLARSKEGITFPDEGAVVDAVFVLIGSRDERNFHLRTLSAIAQIMQDSHFEEKWLRAKTPEALRDIVLLAKRSRSL